MGADGTAKRVLARPDVMDQVVDMPQNRVRILSPFDPALRDRKRAEWLFGYHYRIEIFVPAPKRQYGYYVFPVMEGDQLIGPSSPFGSHRLWCSLCQYSSSFPA